MYNGLKQYGDKSGFHDIHMYIILCFGMPGYTQ